MEYQAAIENEKMRAIDCAETACGLLIGGDCDSAREQLEDALDHLDAVDAGYAAIEAEVDARLEEDEAA